MKIKSPNRLPYSLLALAVSFLIFAMTGIVEAQEVKSSVATAGQLNIYPAAFVAGDRWCVLGDSITEGGYYHHYVELFYSTRFPERKLDVVDCGIRGETAPGALRRLEWDCLAAKPTVVSVMLGMNDVGRSSYKYKDSQDFDKKCNERAETYDQTMRKLTKSLLDSGAKVILIKPSIFDDTADLPSTNLPGCGAALAGYAARVQAIADEFKVATVDFNGPMTAINAEQQKRNPHFSIVGPDRVHPTAPGHFVMAYEFLRAQKLSGAVSRITIDASAGKTGVLENCSVQNLKIQTNEISFTCLEKSLPFPVEEKAAPGLELVPFTQEFNQEILQVRGLTPGDYELNIDGKKIRTFTAVQLAEGVNLAGEPNAPQLKQSLTVLAALQNRWKAVGKLRSIAIIEHSAWPDAKRPLDLAQVSVDLDERLAKIAGTNDTWKAQLKKNYLEGKTHEAELQREAEAAVNAARQAAQPKPHEFVLRRMVSQSGLAPKPFQSGDRWCVLGDSITRSGQYHRYIELFYLTRFPALKLDVVNCGISGDTAPGALQRLQWDCLDAKPTVVSVMLGMNDVRGDLYTPGISIPDIENSRIKVAETYDKAMRQLTKSLADAGVKVILITPSIFDDTADLPRQNSPGCGTALAGFAKRVQKMADEYKLPVVDFNGPMTAINAEQQKRNPKFTIVGGDRVHPTQPGHIVMAYEFLKAQGLSGVVSRITVDAAAGKTGSLENCTVKNLSVRDGEISFICLEHSLPYPVESLEKTALDLVPFTKEFNQEILTVRGLAPGEYRLSIDGKEIRKFSAAELNSGVNLAGETDTPQLQQSFAVLSSLRKKWDVVSKLRNLAYCEHCSWPDAPRPLDFSQMPAKLAAREARVGGKNASVIEAHKEYLEFKPQEKELYREMEGAVNVARLAAQPKPHEFVMRLVREQKGK